jgi:tripartite-type tricarboxylate transporter receptor subunit TctC
MAKFLDRRAFVAGFGVAAGGAMLSGVSTGPAFADVYPARELSWMVHQAPGGLIDSTTRIALPFLKQHGFGATIDYVSGASGRIARARLFNAKPDGHMIMTDTSPDEVLGELFYNGQYKVAEFQPVYGWYLNAFNLFAAKTSAIKNWQDFLNAIKSRRVTVATFGKGNASHLQLAILKKQLHLENLQLVHFAGGAPAYAAALGGHVDVAMGASTTAQRAQTINFLAVFNDKRDPALPDIPTVKELGHAVASVNQLVYVNAGPGVPKDRIAKLAEALEKTFSEPELIEQQKKLGIFISKIPAAEIIEVNKRVVALSNEFRSALVE